MSSCISSPLLVVKAPHRLLGLLAEQRVLPRVLRLALRQVHAPVDLRAWGQTSASMRANVMTVLRLALRQVHAPADLQQHSRASSCSHNMRLLVGSCAVRSTPHLTCKHGPTCQQQPLCPSSCKPRRTMGGRVLPSEAVTASRQQQQTTPRQAGTVEPNSRPVFTHHGCVVLHVQDLPRQPPRRCGVDDLVARAACRGQSTCR